MKTATVTEVGLDFPKVLKWVETGEEVQVVREGKPVAVISPAPRPVKQDPVCHSQPHQPQFHRASGKPPLHFSSNFANSFFSNQSRLPLARRFRCGCIFGAGADTC